ncbi:hypothetical protein PAMP_010663 [Pampus punctatissimus]
MARKRVIYITEPEKALKSDCQSMMNKGSSATNGTACAASGIHDMSSQTSKKVSNANRVNHTRQKNDFNKRQGQGHVAILGQALKECSLSVTSASSLTPRSHQRRWSADLCRCGTSPVIIVKKSLKEPQPPQRGVSLLRPDATSRSSTKRYSCPPIGIFRSPTHSSSSSSSTSSCSSPPPIKTSVITGPDPLGWKLHPKTSSASPKARANRLSLQIPLPITFPDFKSSPAPNLSPASQPDPTSKIKPTLRPELIRRHHSESSAFLRSLVSPPPVVTMEELCGVQLRPVTNLDESDDVFSEEKQKDKKVITRPRKTPPPVAEKTEMARRIAQLIAHPHRHLVTVKTNQMEHIYASVMKPKPKHSHQIEDHRSLHATKPAVTERGLIHTSLADDSKRREPEPPSNSSSINHRGD